MNPYYYIARRAPKGTEIMMITLSRAMQWDVQFIMKMIVEENARIIAPCALYVHNLSPTKVYLHLTTLADYDLLDAFEIPHVCSTTFMRTYRLDDPHLIVHGHGLNYVAMPHAQKYTGV